jgi:hypothetical protein
MAFFRSAALRRVIYAAAIVAALWHVATRLHAAPLVGDDSAESGIVAHLTR